MALSRLKFVVPGDDPPQIQGSSHLDRLEPYGDVTLFTDRPPTLGDQVERARDAHAILNTRGAVKWPGDVLRALPKLRIIATCSIGTDMIDLQAASELGITVSNQPGRTAVGGAPEFAQWERERQELERPVRLFFGGRGEDMEDRSYKLCRFCAPGFEDWLREMQCGRGLHHLY